MGFFTRLVQALKPQYALNGKAGEEFWSALLYGGYLINDI